MTTTMRLPVQVMLLFRRWSTGAYLSLKGKATIYGDLRHLTYADLKGL